MKKYFSLFLVAVMLVLALSSCVLNGTGIVTVRSGKVTTDDGEFFWSLSDEGVLLYEGSGTVQPVPVNKEEVKSVVISSGFSSIGEEAFKNMTNLSDIEIPDTVTQICEEAFENCTSLDEINLPDEIQQIAEDAFEGWQESQQIVSDWYEGSAEYWREWYDYEKEFGELTDSLRAGAEISDEMKCRLSAWWEQWKNSEYWEKAQEYVSEGLDSVNSNYDYWQKFGEYIVSGNEEVTPEAAWWAQAKKITSYLEEKIGDETVTVPEDIQNIIKENQTEIDKAIAYIKEKAGAITEEEVKDYIGQASELWKKYFEK